MPLKRCLKEDAYLSNYILPVRRWSWRLQITASAFPKMCAFLNYSEPQSRLGAGWDYRLCSRLFRPITAQLTIRLSPAVAQRSRFLSQSKTVNVFLSGLVQRKRRKIGNQLNRACYGLRRVSSCHSRELDRRNVPFEEFVSGGKELGK